MCMGKHTVKCWSVTQAVLALSSGEAEFYALVKTASQGLGLRAMLDDLGVGMKLKIMDKKIRIKTDASAARGMALRKGLGPVRHIEVGQLWIQDKVSSGDISVEKVDGKINLADTLTKHSDSGSLEVHISGTGMECRYGRHHDAPDVAGDEVIETIDWGSYKRCETETHESEREEEMHGGGKFVGMMCTMHSRGLNSAFDKGMPPKHRVSLSPSFSPDKEMAESKGSEGKVMGLSLRRESPGASRNKIRSKESWSDVTDREPEEKSVNRWAEGAEAMSSGQHEEREDQSRGDAKSESMPDFDRKETLEIMGKLRDEGRRIAELEKQQVAALASSVAREFEIARQTEADKLDREWEIHRKEKMDEILKHKGTMEVEEDKHRDKLRDIKREFDIEVNVINTSRMNKEVDIHQTFANLRGNLAERITRNASKIEFGSDEWVDLGGDHPTGFDQEIGERDYAEYVTGRKEVKGRTKLLEENRTVLEEFQLSQRGRSRERTENRKREAEGTRKS